MLSSLWQRIALAMFVPALLAADTDVREQLTGQLNERALHMLQTRAKGVAAIQTRAVALLHAAALDKRISRVVITDTLGSFRDIVTEPLHRNAPEYMIPGVLQHYDIPDLIRAIAPRKVEVPNPIDATGAHVPAK